jgi:hypothetical protein
MQANKPAGVDERLRGGAGTARRLRTTNRAKHDTETTAYGLIEETTKS